MNVVTTNTAVDIDIPKPFFIMDWFEDLMMNQDVEKIAELLHTPPKSKSSPQLYPCDDPPTTPKSSNRRRRLRSCRSTSSCSSSDDIKPQRLFEHRKTRTPPKANTSIYKRSIALANGWNAKGLQKARRGLWQDALSCWNNALEIRRPLLGDHHLEVANTLNNKAIALGELGSYQEALQTLEEVLQIRTSNGAEGVITTYHNLANLHQLAGDFANALTVFSHAKQLSIQDRDSVQTARISRAMGHVYYEAKQWQDAKDAYQDASILFQDPLSCCCEEELLGLKRDLEDLNQILMGENKTTKAKTTIAQ